MLRGIKKLSKKEIAEIIRLRRDKHLSYNLIGLLFNRNHATIIFHCRKAGLTSSFSGFSVSSDIGFSIRGMKKEMRPVVYKEIKKKPIVIKSPEVGKSMYEEYLKKYYARTHYVFETDRIKDVLKSIHTFRLFKFS